MALEKENYRDMLQFLCDKGYSMTLTRGECCEILGISRPFLRDLIDKKRIKVNGGKIPIGSVASYLCG